MILSALNDLLQLRGQCSVQEMATSLHTTPDVLRDMLAVLERHGRVRRLPAATPCRGCQRCSPTGQELYEWTPLMNR